MITVVSVIIALILFGFGVYSQYQTKSKSSNPPVAEENAHEAPSTITPTTESIPGPTSDSDEFVQSGNDQPVTTATVPPTVSSPLHYPGATVRSVDGAISQYETNDAGEVVYEWYKNIIDTGNFRTKSSVKTRANDQFKGVLVGDTTTITIEQNSNSESTRITVAEE